MAKSISNAEIEEALGTCASCIGSSGEYFEERQCVGCPNRLKLNSVVPPTLGKDHAIPIGLITKQEIKVRGLGRVIA